MSPLSASAASTFAASTITSIASRSLESDFNTFKDSFSSWDSCMSKAYCKWPVIAAIIVVSLILLSLLVSISRCLCCGLECCFGCLACCNACCPSPRGGGGRRQKEYAQAPQQQAPWPQPYAWQPNMAYGPPGGLPATATFDAPSGASQRAAMVGNQDALPSMPSWQNAQSRRIEEEVYGVIEEEPALALGENNSNAIPMGAVSGDTGAGRSARPYSDDEQRMPMLAAQQPQPQSRPTVVPPQPYERDGYGHHTDTAYAPSLVSPARSPFYDVPGQNPYDAQRRYQQPQQPYQPPQQQYQQPQQNAYSPTNATPETNAYAYQPSNDAANSYAATPPYPAEHNITETGYPDRHTSYRSNATAPPAYHSRGPTPAAYPTNQSISSPTYSPVGATQYDSNPYAWGQGRDEERHVQWSEPQPQAVGRNAVGTWREV